MDEAIGRWLSMNSDFMGIYIHIYNYIYIIIYIYNYIYNYIYIICFNWIFVPTTMLSHGTYYGHLMAFVKADGAVLGEVNIH